MNRTILIVIYGFLVWLIPFLVAIPFYSPDGAILVDEQLFKSIMIVTGAIVGAFLLVKYFKGISGVYIREGFIIGGGMAYNKLDPGSDNITAVKWNESIYIFQPDRDSGT